MTKIRFEALDPRILPEMSAKVSFLSKPATAEDQKPVIAVNPKTLAEREGRKIVFRLSGATLDAVPVTLGRKIGDLQELTGSTLKSGDRLVLSPAEALKAGAQVVVAGK